MEHYYFIVLVVVVLKILFWTFYCYVRAKRAQQPCTVRRVVIVGRPVAQTRPNNHNDQSAIINHAEAMATSPPPYAEVTKGPNGVHPPTYDQAVGGYPHPAASEAMAPPTSGTVYGGSVPGSGYSHEPHPSAPAAVV